MTLAKLIAALYMVWVLSFVIGGLTEVGGSLAVVGFVALGTVGVWVSGWIFGRG